MFFQEYVTHIFKLCAHTFGLYSLQDYIEVTIFSIIIYKSLIWLKQDHTKHLLLGFYAYFTMLIISYATSCTILFTTLLFGLPIFIIFVLIIHQKQLQKNFILSSKQVFASTEKPNNNWIDQLVQACLIASHHNKTITCIIERSQHLKPLLQVPFMLQIPIQKDLISFLLASSKVNNNSLFWIHQSGIIQSINAEWNNELFNELLIKPHNTTSLTHEAALLLTQKTDAVVFSIHTNADTHTIWHQGTSIKQATVQQLLSYVKNIIITAQNQTVLKKRIDHDQSSHIAS